MEPATAVAAGQRRGTSWNSAPLPAPSAAKQTISSSVVATSEPVARPQAASDAPTIISSTQVSVVTPPKRSET